MQNRFILVALFQCLVVMFQVAMSGCAKNEAPAAKAAPAAVQLSGEVTASNDTDKAAQVPEGDVAAWDRPRVHYRDPQIAQLLTEAAAPRSGFTRQKILAAAAPDLGSEAKLAEQVDLKLAPDPGANSSPYEISMQVNLKVRPCYFDSVDLPLPMAMAEQNGPFILIGPSWKVAPFEMKKAQSDSSVKTMGSDPLGPVPVYDLRTGKVFGHFSEEIPFFRKTVLSPNGMSAVTGRNDAFEQVGEDSALYVWTMTPMPVAETKPAKPTPRPRSGRSSQKSNDAKRADESSVKPTAIVTKPPRKIPIDRQVAAVKYIDNRRIAVWVHDKRISLSAVEDREIQIWDIAKLEKLSSTQLGPCGFKELETALRGVQKLDRSPALIAISPGGTYIAVASTKQIDIIESATGRILGGYPLEMQSESLQSYRGLWFSQDGTELCVLFAVHKSTVLCCWRLADGVRSRFMKLDSGGYEVQPFAGGQLIKTLPSAVNLYPSRWLPVQADESIPLDGCYMLVPQTGPSLKIHQPVDPDNPSRQDKSFYVTAVARSELEGYPSRNAKLNEQVAVKRDSANVVSIPGDDTSVKNNWSSLKIVPSPQKELAKYESARPIERRSSPFIWQISTSATSSGFDKSNQHQICQIQAQDVMAATTGIQSKLEVRMKKYLDLDNIKVEPGNKRVALISPENQAQVIVWQLADNQSTQFSPGEGWPVEALVWTAGGLVVLSNGELSLWNIQADSIVKVATTQGGQYVAPLKSEPTGTRVLVSRGGDVDLLNGATLEIIARYPAAAEGAIQQLAMAAGGKWIAASYLRRPTTENAAALRGSATLADSVGVWDSQTGKVQPWTFARPTSSFVSWITPEHLCFQTDRSLAVYDARVGRAVAFISNQLITSDQRNGNRVQLASSDDGVIWRGTSSANEHWQATWEQLEVQTEFLKGFEALFAEDRTLVDLSKAAVSISLDKELNQVHGQESVEKQFFEKGFQIGSGYRVDVKHRMVDSNLKLTLKTVEGSSSEAFSFLVPKMETRWSVFDQQNREIWYTLLDWTYQGRVIRHGGERPDMGGVAFPNTATASEIHDAFRSALLPKVDVRRVYIPKQIVVSANGQTPIPIEIGVR